MTNMKRKILVVVAHRDDETIGMGGTIARHSENGDSVYCLSLTDGVSSRNNVDEKTIKQRIKASEVASEKLGFKWLESEDFPDNALDSIPLLAIVKAIEQSKVMVEPTLVYTHTKACLNIDHRIVCDAVLTAFRPQPEEKCKQILTFEIPSSTDYSHPDVTNYFFPNFYKDISKTWSKKLEALKAYSAEMRKYPHPRSLKAIENFAKINGNKVGLNYAEGFQLLRKID